MPPLSRRTFCLGSATLIGLPPLAAAAQPREHTVVMSYMTFGKMPTGVKVGDTIIWTNRDSVLHTATARDRGFDIRVQRGQSVRMVVQKAGAIAVYCLYHPAMRATLNVAAQ